MAPEIQKSDIVLSQSGRDQGRMMVVLDTDADYLLLADGRLRRVESPKRKKRKHVRFVSHGQEELARRLREGAKLSNCRNGSSPRLQNDRGGNFVWQKKI